MVKLIRGGNMQSKLKSLLINLTLVIAIVVTVWIAYVGFIGGPARAYEKEDVNYVQAFLESKKYDSAQLLNRFSFDQVYYIVQYKNKSEEKIAWFSKDFKKQGNHALVSNDTVLDFAKRHDLSEDKIHFGVFEDKLMFVYKNGSKEVFYDVDSLELVYSRE